MSIIRVGTNSKYADNWAKAFGGGKSADAAKAKSPAKKAGKKKAAKKK